VPHLFEARRVDGVTISSTPGVLVSAGNATEGSWVDIISAAQNVYGGNRLTLLFTAAFGAGADWSQIVDVGLGTTPAGRAIIVENLPVGYTSPAKPYVFPLLIPPGVAVRARSQAATTGRSVRISAYLTRGASLWTGSKVQALSTLTGPRGVNLTAGNGAWSSWADLVASVSGNWRGFYIAIQGGADTSLGNRTKFMYQVGVGATPRIVTPSMPIVTDGSEFVYEHWPHPFLVPLVNGTRVQHRAACEVVANRLLDYTLVGIR
jgi:hypothetical protein